MVYNINGVRDAQKVDLHTLPSVEQKGDIVLSTEHVREWKPACYTPGSPSFRK